MKAKIKRADDIKVGERIETNIGMRTVLKTEPNFKDSIFVWVQDPAGREGQTRLSMLRTSRVVYWTAEGCGGCGTCPQCVASQARAEAAAID